MSREPFIPTIGTELIVYDPCNGNSADVIVRTILPPGGYGHAPQLEANAKNKNVLYILSWSYQWLRWIIYGEKPLQ